MEASAEQINQAQLNRDRAETNRREKPSISAAKASGNAVELVLILPIAIMADALNVLDLTGFLALLVRVISLPMLAILWFWRFFKQGSKINKKNDAYQLLLAFFIEISPFGFIPTWTTFVLYSIFKDKNIVKK